MQPAPGRHALLGQPDKTDGTIPRSYYAAVRLPHFRGNTESGIIFVEIGDITKTSKAGALLMEAGVYANPIQFPAVSVKNSRIRISIMATHTIEHLDKVLNAFEYVDRKLGLIKQK